MISLTGRKILVCGGSRGIGAETARMAATAGADVAVSYRSDERAALDVVKSIKELGHRACALQGDLSDPDTAANVVLQACEFLDGLDGVVISAGIFAPAPIEEMTVKFWDHTMAVNVRLSYLVVKAAVKPLRKAGGSIVIYASTAGQRGSEIYSAYATSKGAQIMFMRSMARELGGSQIRVNCVAPGWTETDMSKEPLDEIGRASVEKEIPLGRIGQPKDPAGAALFLLSDLASFITGSTITVDGGFDMRG